MSKGLVNQAARNASTELYCIGSAYQRGARAGQMEGNIPAITLPIRDGVGSDLPGGCGG
jgi:hypothetical protein